MKRDSRKPVVIGLIPARGGSRRIPGKNLADICGRPLIAYTIDASRRAKRLTRTIVSTDDQEIAEVSRKLGAEVPFLRPSRLATDKAKSIDVIRHAARWLEKHGPKLRAMVLLQPTSPLRAAAHIDNAVRLFFASGCDSVVSVCRCSSVLTSGAQGERKRKLLRMVLPDGRLGPWRSGRSIVGAISCGTVVPSGRLGAWDGDTGRSGLRSGARPVTDSSRPCMLNGAVYVLGRRALFGGVPIENDRTMAFIMPVEVSVDVDEPEDLIAAAKQLSRRADAR